MGFPHLFVSGVPHWPERWRGPARIIRQKGFGASTNSESRCSEASPHPHESGVADLRRALGLAEKIDFLGKG